MTRISITIGLLLLVTASFCHAGSPDEWQFEITPYLWAVGKDGRTGVRNVRGTGADLIADVDLSISGGADAGHFSINAATGALAFAAAKDFEAADRVKPPSIQC